MSERVAAVLGVGPGLGAAVARRFARGGFATALMARRPASLEATEKQIRDEGGRAVSVEADAADPKSVARAFARVRELVGDSAVLVYNAGAFRPGGILDISPEEFEACWRANCAGGFYAAQQVLPAMVDAGAGTLLFTGATASLRGSARFSALAVGKFGLRALTQSIARELGPRGIHAAHIIIDGQIDTPRVRAASPGRDPDTLLSTEAIAETYWQLCHQHRTAWTLEMDLRPAVEKF